MTCAADDHPQAQAADRVRKASQERVGRAFEDFPRPTGWSQPIGDLGKQHSRRKEGPGLVNPVFARQKGGHRGGKIGAKFPQVLQIGRKTHLYAGLWL